MTIRQNMGLHSLVRVARQSAFGSAASDGFRPVRYFNWPLVETRPLVDSNALGAAPANFGDALPPVQGARAVPPGVMRVPLCWNEIGIWLGLLLGNPVSTDLGAGNYSHVFTGGAETIPVATADVRRTRISGTDTWDAWHDLAVLQAHKVPDDLEAATLRSTQNLRPGDHVVAVGFPFGIGPSASAGVVSGLQREFTSPEGKRQLSNLIQFDAAANPGNSGGPLVTLDGEVVGIVTAILNPTQARTFIGIGFAVPIENAASAVGMPPF